MAVLSRRVTGCEFWIRPVESGWLLPASRRGRVLVFLYLFGKLCRRQIDNLGTTSLLRVIIFSIIFDAVASRLFLGRRLLANHRLRPVRTRLAIGMLCLAFLGSVDRGLMQTIIVIRELRIGLGGDPFAGGGGIMCQRLIFLVQLLCIASQLHFRPIGLI